MNEMPNINNPNNSEPFIETSESLPVEVYDAQSSAIDLQQELHAEHESEEQERSKKLSRCLWESAKFLMFSTQATLIASQIIDPETEGSPINRIIENPAPNITAGVASAALIHGAFAFAKKRKEAAKNRTNA